MARVRAELVSITPQVSGKIVRIRVQDNQLVKAGTLLFTLDPEPIASRWTTRQRGPGQGQVGFRQRRSTRRTVARASPAPSSPPEAVDESRLNAQAMKAAYEVAQANLEQAQMVPLPGPRSHAASDGIPNLQARVGNYATAGCPWWP